MHDIWRRIFERKASSQQSVTVTPSSLPAYCRIIIGRKRSRLTARHLDSLNTSFYESNGSLHVDVAIEDDLSSLLSFVTCRSTFQDESVGLSNVDLITPLVGASHAFVHYISRERLRTLAKELQARMERHFSEGFAMNDDDTMGKYLCPGLGWDVRPDEVGPNVLTPSDMQRIDGLWRNDLECGDDIGPLIDVMEMAWIYKKAARLIHYTEVHADEHRIGLYPRMLGISFPTVSYWTREGKIIPRRDLRKGVARVSTVPTTFGFRQFIQWGQPYAGFAVVEGQLSQDLNSFETLTYTQRYAGQHCCLRSVFRRVSK